MAHRCELSLMYARRSCLPLSFLCVLKSPLLQTVWGAEMVDGEGCCVGGVGGGGGEAADVAAGQNQLAV